MCSAGIRDIAEDAHDEVEELHRACELDLELQQQTCAETDLMHTEGSSSPAHSIRYSAHLTVLGTGHLTHPVLGNVQSSTSTARPIKA